MDGDGAVIDGIELEGMDDEEMELQRVTSLDALNGGRGAEPPSPLSASSSEGDLPYNKQAYLPHHERSSITLDVLNSSLSSISPLSNSNSEPSLATSLDNLTITIKDGGDETLSSSSPTSPPPRPSKKPSLRRLDTLADFEQCVWAVKFLGTQGELDCFIKSVKTMFNMHMYSLLCMIVVGVYISTYVPLVISKELEYKLTWNGHYSNVALDTRLSLGIGYGLHNAYVGLYGMILMMLVIGYEKMKPFIPYNIFMSCAIFSFIFPYYYVESFYNTVHSYYSIIVYILIGIQILGTAGAFGYKVGHLKAVLVFTAGITIAVLVFVGIIDYIGVPVFMGASNFGKSVFRISVVPCVLVVKVVAIRMLCRISDFSTIYMSTDGSTLSFTIALIPVFIRAFYGRIFYLNVPSLGNLAWNAIVVEVFDLLFKLMHWNRRYALQVIRPIVRKHYYLKPLIDKPSGDAFYALCLCFEKTVDILAIGFATLIQILYQYKWETNPDYGATIASMVIQYIIEAIAQMVSFRLEHGFGIPSLSVANKNRFWTVYPILVSTAMVVAVTCTWRGVFIVHGTYWR